MDVDNVYFHGVTDSVKGVEAVKFDEVKVVDVVQIILIP